MEGFHPIIRRWFRGRFKGPTAPQEQGWPAIRAGRHTLIAAPTGSGKTLTAFLVCLDRLVAEAAAGKLADTTRILYVSPLKALSNDVRRNLEVPLGEIAQTASAMGITLPEIRATVRTGDTSQSQRQAMIRRPPHILVTTPESLFLLLTGEKSREILRTVDTVIIDEIHALARDKRGSHLALSLERLDRLCDRPPQRIGLSATQKPLEQVGEFLIGAKHAASGCKIIDVGHQRDLDLGIETPASELSAVCSNEQWEEAYFRIKQLIETHRSTLIFVNTRRHAERVAFHLSQHLGEDAVASHHGSLSKDKRLDAEERLKRGELKAIVATASLELGIDVGYIDLVIQVGSPRSIATFLQRVGRSGHSLGALPKGRILALTRDELIEALALIRAVKKGRLDALEIPIAPLDILAQQLIAATAEEEQDEDDLYELVRGAYPYKDLDRRVFDQVVEMLADGFAKGRGKFAYLHRDPIKRKLRAKRGARLAAATSGGAIPEQGDFRVILEGDGSFVGTLNEDFAIESMAGDIFLLGNTSWQIVQVRGGEVIVRDAHGAPPTIPFWIGEAPGRTIELSTEVSELRREISERIEIGADPDDPLYRLESLEAIRTLDPPQYRSARQWLGEETGVEDWSILQAVHYVAVQKAALGVVPTQEEVVFERFFDDSGGMQLVIHAPFGMRINRGWGLALRKRFCRSFDFELQASADDDGIVLSLGPQHSFPIDQLFSFLNTENVQPLLEQALLQVPLFQIRWRWNANRSLAVLRNQAGKRVPPALQRFRADDLMTAVFPAQTACKENVTGDIEFPDHPLVNQTLYDCLHEAIDIDRLRQVIGRIRRGEIKLVARDTREPSPFSYKLLNAYPYAFLDDAPLEERRARAVATRRTLSIETLRDLGSLDQEAMAQVAREAWPMARDADELHDVLLGISALPEAEADQAWRPLFETLMADGRATVCKIGPHRFWTVAVAIDQMRAAYPGATFEPEIELPQRLRQEWSREDATSRLLRGYLEICGVITAKELSRRLAIPLNHVEAHLVAIEASGTILRGLFTGGEDVEWCDRRLLTRIHRLTLDGLRRQIRPVSIKDYRRFLFRHHGLVSGLKRRGAVGVHHVIAQLQGFSAAAGAWEREILPARILSYTARDLDELCHGGEVAWGRLETPRADETGEAETARATPVTRTMPLSLVLREDLPWLLPSHRGDASGVVESLSSKARVVYDALRTKGAMFPAELQHPSGLLESEMDDALAELVRQGLASADGFSAIRPLVNGDRKKSREVRRGLPSRFRRPAPRGGGRWSLFPGNLPEVPPEERLERWAWLLLERYGVLFRDLLAREGAAPTWGELVQVLRRLEAQGEIRGGRFVAGVSGEQYALWDAVERLRAVRESNEAGEIVVIGSSDPLNLHGILEEGARLPAGRGGAIAYLEGEAIALKDAGEIRFLRELDPEMTTRVRRLLTLEGPLRYFDEDAIEAEEEDPTS